MHWVQTYDPLGTTALSVAVAALPIATLLLSILVFRVRTPVAALLGLGCALAVALFGFGMPAPLAFGAAAYGAAYGLLPIGWLVLNILFLYRLTVRCGAFALLQRRIARITPDKRLQLLLIAFGFGSFFEGCAGFGAPVAITGAMLVGLGFAPLAAARLALIANTAPVAFGSLGTPVIALSAVTGLPLHDLSAMIGRQLPFFSTLIPFWLIAAFAGWRGMLAVWPALLVAALGFSVPQFLVSNYHGPWLVDIVSATTSIGALGLFLHWWHPRHIWHETGAAEPDDTPASLAGSGAGGGIAVAIAPDRGPGAYGGIGRIGDGGSDGRTGKGGNGTATDRAGDRGGQGNGRGGHGGDGEGGGGSGDGGGPAPGPVPVPTPASTSPPVHASASAPAPDVPAPDVPAFYAWLPWVILCAGVILWGLPATRVFLDGLFAPALPVPGLDGAVVRVPPVVPAPHAEAATFALNLLSATGTGILLSAVLAGLALGLRPGELVRTYGATLRMALVPLGTIATMLALGTVTRYSGADTVLGLALARASGPAYPFFGTLLGWLGVAATGSDTASNVLFGSLQRTTAEQLGLDPVLMAAANSSGGVIGKMADAQSIVVAAAATGIGGKEAEILRYVLFHSVALVALVALFVLGQAYIWPLSLMRLP